MTFIGRLKTISHVFVNWRGNGFVTGHLMGVLFRWEPGNIYRTDPLTAEQIEVLKGHEAVILEAVDVDLGAVQPSIDSATPEIPASMPKTASTQPGAAVTPPPIPQRPAPAQVVPQRPANIRR